MQISTLLCVWAFLAGVEGTCRKRVIEKIENLRSTSPTPDMLPQLIGKETTWLTSSIYIDNLLTNATCARTYFHKNGSVVIGEDEYSFDHSSYITLSVYKATEEPGSGYLTFSGDDSIGEDRFYTISFKDNFLVYYQCHEGRKDSYPSFGGVAVVSENFKEVKNSQSFDEHLDNAESLLKSLGIPAGEMLDTDCV